MNNEIEFYDFRKNWRKARSFVEDVAFRDLVFQGMDLLLDSYCGKQFEYEKRPVHYDICEWRIIPGRKPAYHDFVATGSQHWLVNAYLYWAMRVEPHRSWRILAGKEYSVVWDGQAMLFDPHGLALDLDPEWIFQETYKFPLPIGHFRNLYPAVHYTKIDWDEQGSWLVTKYPEDRAATSIEPVLIRELH